MNGRGWLGLLLMKCGYSYGDSLALVNELEDWARSQGYVISVERLEDQEA